MRKKTESFKDLDVRILYNRNDMITIMSKDRIYLQEEIFLRRSFDD
ncbi:hypothetical protein JW823_05950 [bacterium]|nr:hypothetical protein [candidate division CSSED10-310 bacterium]